MAMLHLVNRESALRACLDAAMQDDAIVLIEDAVYAATADSARNLIVLGVDAEARGLSQRLHCSVSTINYVDLVELTVEFTPIVTWC